MSSDQNIASDADLVAWAKAHGPDYLRYAAERGFAIKAGVMDTIAEMVAKEFGGRVVRPGNELIDWKERREPSAENATRGRKVRFDFAGWFQGTPLPEDISYSASEVVRVEEQPDPTNPDDTLKYSGVVLTLRHPATAERFIVVNLEAGK